ncbi:hypothetical protein GCM10007301_10110 [Azorhizobium oxalatiphilum]|uniref:Uncharacterized protein n=1 Tax=Azorhizobium oxalatiphilum TaxID=980631 RepID=A0A917BN61_9HYPH|nr:hypothetical protein GCM10007301_10110 [Azorhizobium oxalatiphilum]
MLRALGVIFVFLMLGLAVQLRHLQTMPIGTGESQGSPDGRYVASVMDYTERHFFTGEPRNWFEFEIEGPGFSYRQTGTPIPGPYFGSRSSYSVIHWEPDSSAVRFVFPGAELRFKVGPQEK